MCLAMVLVCGGCCGVVVVIGVVVGVVGVGVAAVASSVLHPFHHVNIFLCRELVFF